MWLWAFGCNFGKKMEKINLLKQQEQLAMQTPRPHKFMRRRFT